MVRRRILSSILPRIQALRSYRSTFVQGTRLEYVSYSTLRNQMEAPPIVVMHDLNLSGESWRHVASNLSQHGLRQVITVDARNHGLSPHISGHSAMHLAADVEALMSHQSLTKIVALGHGMGGRAMMTLALTQPQLVERVILVDITPAPVPSNFYLTRQVFEMMLQVAPTIPRNLSLSEGRMFILPIFQDVVQDVTELQRVVFNLRKMQDASFGWAVNPQAVLSSWSDLMIDYESTLGGLSPYMGEVLLIAGSQSEFVTSSSISVMQRYFPNTVVQILDAGHCVYEDQPEQFVKLVVEFTQVCLVC
ncbi:sn-1-specific diacylglycerol lipase ABHD11 [Drosophila takahashii]|uniref:sn-1-specific diacylglycerol lipase ABHD11 n=1 Tax=Drosophila takahashii TaxID=29030 RepID=UPI001CF88012|nr:protein ABHD11 [Drosophila takahashii]